MEWYLYAILGSLFTGFAALTHKKGRVSKTKSLDFSATLAIINLIISVPFLFILDYSQLTDKAFFILFFGSFFATGGFFYFTKAIKHMELSKATPFLAFGPVVIAFFAFIFLGERLSLIQIIGIILIIFGALFLESDKKFSLKELYKDLKYLKYVFISLIIYGVSALVDRILLSKSGAFAMDTITYLTLMHVFIALNFFMLTFILSEGFHSIKKAFSVSGVWIILLAIFTFTYRFFQSKAMEIAPAAAFVSVIKRSSIVITVFLGGKLFHEGKLYKKMIATIIMVLGNFLIILF